MNPLDEKFKNEKLVFERITNNDLCCKSCRFKYDDKDIPANTSTCEWYTLKPDEVLDGDDCHLFESE